MLLSCRLPPLEYIYVMPSTVPSAIITSPIANASARNDTPELAKDHTPVPIKRIPITIVIALILHFLQTNHFIILYFHAYFQQKRKIKSRYLKS